MEDKLQKFMPGGSPQAASAPSTEYQLVSFFQETVSDMRGQINEAFAVVAQRLEKLEAERKNETIPARVELALRCLNYGIFTKDECRKYVAEYFDNGQSVPAADEERAGRTAAGDDEARQGHVQAEVQPDELGGEAEASPLNERDSRSPE